jgi:hypothetical protein
MELVPENLFSGGTGAAARMGGKKGRERDQDRLLDPRPVHICEDHYKDFKYSTRSDSS